MGAITEKMNEVNLRLKGENIYSIAVKSRDFECVSGTSLNKFDDYIEAKSFKGHT